MSSTGQLCLNFVVIAQILPSVQPVMRITCVELKGIRKLKLE